jgi:hypothetical protein
MATGTLRCVTATPEQVVLDEDYKGPNGGTSTWRLIVRLSDGVLTCSWYAGKRKEAGVACRASMTRY